MTEEKLLECRRLAEKHLDEFSISFVWSETYQGYYWEWRLEGKRRHTSNASCCTTFSGAVNELLEEMRDNDE